MIRARTGAVHLEYVLIAAILGTLLIVALVYLGSGLVTSYEDLGDHVEEAAG